MNEPEAPAEAARSRSTSSRTISAEFPPSSKCTRFRCWRGDADAPARPVEPVKAITGTIGGSTSAAPTSGAAGEHVQHPGGQACLLEDPGDHHASGDGGPRIGFQDHGVAEGQGRCHGAHRENERQVERGDHAHHPDR